MEQNCGATLTVTRVCLVFTLKDRLMYGTVFVVDYEHQFIDLLRVTSRYSSSFFSEPRWS